VVFSLAQPYKETYLNHLERGALSINIITLLFGMGLFTNDQAGDDAKSVTLAMLITIGIVVCNVFFVFSVGRTLFTHSQYCAVCKQKKKNDLSATVSSSSMQQAERNKHMIIAMKLRHNVRLTLKQQTQNKDQRSERSDRKAYAALKLRQTLGRQTMGRQKSKRTKRVEEIEQIHTKHRNSAVQSILQKQTDAAKRLEMRLEIRLQHRQAVSSPIKTNTSIVHVAAAPQNNEKELTYQNEKKNLATFILRLNKDNDKLIRCFERLKPLEIKNALNQSSLTLLFQKLNIPQKTSDRLTKDIIETKGWVKGSHLVITKTQFVRWAEEIVDTDEENTEEDKEEEKEVLGTGTEVPSYMQSTSTSRRKSTTH
jgi:hypothetical protein